MNEVRRAHFAQSRKLIDQYKGREIKTMGDGFMAAFRSVEKALDYARDLQANPGHKQVQILRRDSHRADTCGGRRCLRRCGELCRPCGGRDQGGRDLVERPGQGRPGPGGLKQHAQLKWERHDGVQMNGFTDTFTLWSLSK